MKWTERLPRHANIYDRWSDDVGVGEVERIRTLPERPMQGVDTIH